MIVKTSAQSSPNPGRPTRAYHSPLRAEQARQTRTRIVRAAGGLFAERGYSATTLQAIADAAGVSVVSVQLNGPKSALLLAALELLSTGSEGFDSAVEIPEFAARAAQISSPADVIELTAEFATVSNQRVSKLWLAMDRAAEDDADVGHTFRDLIQRMRRDALTAITTMSALGAVRADRTPEELADIYWALPLPDLYHRLVEQCGWPLDRYTDWLRQTLSELLLPRPEGPPRSDPS
jgi:AcrR family transcriptional regulator